MRPLKLACCLCAVALTVSSCQTLPVPDIQATINTLDFDLGAGDYVVRPGQTLETIAFRYNTTAAELRKLNPGIGPAVIAGTRIKIRQPMASPKAPITREATFQAPVEMALPEPVQTTPIQDRQAAAVMPVIPEQQLLGAERYIGGERLSGQTSDITSTPTIQTIERVAVPEETEILDPHFTLPNANTELLEADVGGWQWPLDGQLARDFNPNRRDGTGVDIVGLPGQEIYATREGEVVWIARLPDSPGKIIIVRHDDDYLSVYSNAQQSFVRMNEKVEQGQAIANLGANANDEPLLRFEISKNGNFLNPNDFLLPR